ncbi:hypothetical protein M5K25_025949 [Dendrobium thyrsiflorum]|uniref:Uncharacterized protein n=1 Tax=Dendrobium thyrsiflorum TaxID=117978 RepID=A0ABD0TW18_DENTH
MGDNLPLCSWKKHKSVKISCASLMKTKFPSAPGTCQSSFSHKIPKHIDRISYEMPTQTSVLAYTYVYACALIYRILDGHSCSSATSMKTSCVKGLRLFIINRLSPLHIIPKELKPTQPRQASPIHQLALLFSQEAISSNNNGKGFYFPLQLSMLSSQLLNLHLHNRITLDCHTFEDLLLPSRQGELNGFQHLPLNLMLFDEGTPLCLELKIEDMEQIFSSVKSEKAMTRVSKQYFEKELQQLGPIASLPSMRKKTSNKTIGGDLVISRRQGTHIKGSNNKSELCRLHQATIPSFSGVFTWETMLSSSHRIVIGTRAPHLSHSAVIPHLTAIAPVLFELGIIVLGKASIMRPLLADSLSYPVKRGSALKLRKLDIKDGEGGGMLGRLKDMESVGVRLGASHYGLSDLRCPPTMVLTTSFPDYGPYNLCHQITVLPTFIIIQRSF